MKYLEWFLTSSYELLCTSVTVFGYTFRFVDLDLFVMLAGILIFVVRRLIYD